MLALSRPWDLGPPSGIRLAPFDQLCDLMPTFAFTENETSFMISDGLPVVIVLVLVSFSPQ